MKRKVTAILLIMLMLISTFVLSGCGKKKHELKDGYFTAQAAEYNRGWKEFVTIHVRDGKIISVEYNAKNSSGFIKSWDMDYMRLMNMIAGNYPNRYTREYGGQLLEAQDPQEVDGLTGATSSYHSFQQLATAAIEQARNGNHDVAIVQIKE